MGASHCEKPGIVIAGVGMVSPLGHGAWPTFSALLAGKTVAERAAAVESGADVVELAQATGGVSVARHSRTDPSVELAEWAAREAAQAGGISPAGVPTYLGASKGAVAAMSRATAGLLENSTGNEAGWQPAPQVCEALREDALAVALGPHGYLAYHLAQRTGITVRSCHVAACASGLIALHQARRALMNPDHPPYALVVSAEAALSGMFIHSYRRLGVLAALTPEAYRARPLDVRRAGFVLSEVGAAVLLKRLPAGESAAGGQIALLDTAVACEAYDLIRTDPRMSALRHIAGKLFAGRKIDVIHPHAPGTVDHDAAELAALNDVLGGCAHEEGVRGEADVYACKGALGHTLGAAGLASLVVAWLCLKAGRRPGMPWLDQAIEVDAARRFVNVDGAERVCRRDGVHAIFAAGFGGHTAGAVIGGR